MSPATAAAPAVTVPVCASGDAAGFAVAFEPVEARVSGMRKIMNAHLRLWRVPEPLVEDVLVALSELVTNAVVHGNGAVGLEVRCSSKRLRIEVTDGSPAPAELRYAEDGDVSGRGLFLVAYFATEWGVSDDGMTTWCEFELVEGRA